jgi:hydroxymethylpyrimidine pyrophosphatase-like HAD family hydrolase
MKNKILLSPTDPNNPFLLAADIDGTLLGDDVGESLLGAFAEIHPESMRLAYVTGRSLCSVLELVEKECLPCPDFICSDVGTELFDCTDSTNVIGKRFAAQVSLDWDLEKIYTLGEGNGVWRQDFPEGQPRFQAGFFWDGNPEALATFQQRLTDHQSYQIFPAMGMYIDVIPGPLGKGKAVQFLQHELGLDPARVVVAGDSGNDRPMFETGFKGIVPANALLELKAIASQPWHYHSSLPVGRGVIDGLHHFGFIR